MSGQDDRVGRLYGLSPEEFIAARDRLAKDLRDDDRETSAAIKKLRRPTVAAWALNQAARREPKLVEKLFEASDELRRVQSGGAGSAELKQATTARRRAVERLAGVAREVAAGTSGSHEEDITQTLLATATDAGVRDRLRSGTLERAAAPTANFADLGSVLASSVGVVAPSRKKASSTAAAPAEPPALDTRALEGARRRAETLDAQAGEAEDEAGRLDGEARDAERAAERVRREADVAERAATEARTRADRARTKAAKARSKADEAAGALAELEASRP